MYDLTYAMVPLHARTAMRSRDTPWAVEFSAFPTPPKDLRRKVKSFHLFIYPLITHPTSKQPKGTMKQCICVLKHASKPKPTLATLGSRGIHTPAPIPAPILSATIPYSSSQFTIPPLLPFPSATNPYESQGKGKGKGPERPRSNEEEVDDAEWQMRVGTLCGPVEGQSMVKDADSAGRAMLHLRDTLPQLLESGHPSSELFPPDIYSSNVILKLPAPLPIRVSFTLPPQGECKADVRSLRFRLIL